MDYFGVFLGAFISTWLVACVAQLGIRYLASSQPERFGAFCVALGFAIAVFSGRAPIGPEAAKLVLGAAGAVLALLILWYHWFKRMKVDETSSTES